MDKIETIKYSIESPYNIHDEDFLRRIKYAFFPYGFISLYRNGQKIPDLKAYSSYDVRTDNEIIHILVLELNSKYALSLSDVRILVSSYGNIDKDNIDVVDDKGNQDLAGVNDETTQALEPTKVEKTSITDLPDIKQYAVVKESCVTGFSINSNNIKGITLKDGNYIVESIGDNHKLIGPFLFQPDNFKVRAGTINCLEVLSEAKKEKIVKLEFVSTPSGEDDIDQSEYFEVMVRDDRDGTIYNFAVPAPDIDFAQTSAIVLAASKYDIPKENLQIMGDG